MRHTGLDPVSPTSIEGFKIISPFIIRPTMRFRVAAQNDKQRSIPQGVLSFRHSEQRSKAERDSESPALG